MHRGFITLHRKIVEWEWYSDTNVFRIFIHLILTANWEPKKWKGVPVKRGQKITSIQHMAKETGLTEQSVRTAIKKLKLTGELTTEATNKYTLVTLINYDFYQDKEKQLTNKTTSNLTNEQQTTNKQLTTTKPLNNITIKQKENKIPAFFDKKASDELTFADELDDESPTSEKSKICEVIEKQFDEFWTMYPKKVDKPGAKKKYILAIKKKRIAHETIMAGLKGYVVCDEVLKGFICHPTTWINQERWATEYKNSKQEALDAWFADGPSDETLGEWESEIEEIERNKCK